MCRGGVGMTLRIGLVSPVLCQEKQKINNSRNFHAILSAILVSLSDNQKFSVSMSLSAVSAGCPGENQTCVSSARTTAALACIKISTRRYNGGDRWVCSFEILNHLEKKTRNSKQYNNIPG